MPANSITVETKSLADALSYIRAAVGRAQTLPILGNVLIQPLDGKLRLTGTDLEAQMSVDIPYAGSAAFHTTVSAAKLYDISRLLPEGELNLTLGDGEVMARMGRSRYKLKTLPPSDFPLVQVADNARRFRVPERMLAGMLGEVDSSMATQDVRYFLNGALLTANSDCVQMVATDGHRLALSRAVAPASTGIDTSVIVPRGFVSLMEKMLSVAESEIDVGITSNHIMLEKPGCRLIGKLIDGKYPDYNRVIPKDHPHRAVAERAALRDTLNRVQVLADEKTKGVLLMFSPGELALESKTSDGQESNDMVPIEYEGPEITVGVNILYLLDCLDSIGGEKVTIDFRDNMSCLLIKGGNDNALYVVMPMRM